MSSAVDALLSSTGDQKPTTVDIVNVIRRLATNKDLKKLISALNGYSKSDWAAFMKTCKTAYHVFQSSLLIKNDSMLANEMRKYPHLVVFFERLENET